MPNRMLRDWTNSDKVDIITFQAEVFFTRLIMKADDHGCFWADPKRLKANLFPLKSDSIRDADIPRWIAECEKAGLIVVYESDNKKYLQIIKFGQRLRNKKSKYPLPNDGDLRANGSDPPPEVEEEYEVEEKEHERAREVDLKNSNLFRKPTIPTKHQVLETFVSAGGDKEMARAFWNKHEGTGWFINGSPIENYVSLAHNFIKNWKQRKNGSDGPEQDLNAHLKPL